MEIKLSWGVCFMSAILIFDGCREGSSLPGSKETISHKQGKDPALSGFKEESERKRHLPIRARGPE